MGGFRALSFDRGDSLFSILQQLYKRFVYFYPADIWGNNWVICCTICLFLLIPCFRQRLLVRIPFVLFCVAFFIYFLIARFFGPLENCLPAWNEVLSQRMNLLFFWGVLLIIFLFRWNGEKTKQLLIFLWLSVPAIILPLVAIKVITYRYYFCSNLFLIEFALALLACEFGRLNSRLAKGLPVIICLALVGTVFQRFVIYAQIGVGKRDRDARIQQARDGEITRLYFPELPHSEYLWLIEAPDGSEQVPFFREFYRIPDGVEMSNLPDEG